MKVIVSSKRPCRLDRGEVRRVPQDRAHPVVGYHVCCPRCRFVTPALHGVAGLRIHEGDDASELTFSQPLRCTFCRVLLHFSFGHLRLEEDAEIRRAVYR